MKSLKRNAVEIFPNLLDLVWTIMIAQNDDL